MNNSILNFYELQIQTKEQKKVLNSSYWSMLTGEYSRIFFPHFLVEIFGVFHQFRCYRENSRWCSRSGGSRTS